MARYVLLAGFHAHGDKMYSPGDVVESETDLAGRFPEKFEPWTDQDESAEAPQDEREEENV